MAVPRSQIVDPNDPGLYHCFSRCVRRAFLMGPEHDHRRAWIEQRLEFLCSIFAVDDAAHSAMSNHLHVLARIDPPRAEGWSAEEVVRRWGRLHPKSVLARAGVVLKRGAVAPDELPDDAIPANVRSVLESLHIDVDRWVVAVTSSTRLFGTAIGSAASLAIEAARRGMKRVVGALDVCAER